MAMATPSDAAMLEAIAGVAQAGTAYVRRNKVTGHGTRTVFSPIADVESATISCTATAVERP